MGEQGGIGMRGGSCGEQNPGARPSRMSGSQSWAGLEGRGALFAQHFISVKEPAKSEISGSMAKIILRPNKRPWLIEI